MTRLCALALLLALAFAVAWRISPEPPPPVRPVTVASRVVLQNKAAYHQWRRENIFGIRDNRRVRL